MGGPGVGAGDSLSRQGLKQRLTVIPAKARLHGWRAFGELSGSAELAEDRAVAERRLPAAGKSGTSAEEGRSV